MQIIEKKIIYGGSKENRPDRIIIHSMGENIKNNEDIYDAYEWLNFLKLSVHALILPNGDILRCRKDDQRAWHAKGFNTNSLGVEFLVPGLHDYGSFLEMIKTDWVSEEQYKSGIYLIRQWIKEYQIESVLRHKDVSPGRKLDPGDGFKWDWFLGECWQ